MKIGILETGRPPEQLAPQYGDYPSMFARLLADDDFEFESYAALDGELPDSPRACDGWVITGSKFGVYEGHPWIAQLEEFLRQAYAEGVPIVGICFGHQILAQALSGKVEKFTGGWDVGKTAYRIENAEGGEDELKMHAWHQDQVTELPEGARVIGSTPFCKYAALAYDNKALTIQPHPEFAEGYVRDLIESRRGILPAEITERGLSSLGGDIDSAAFARRIKDFLKAPR